MTGDGVDDIAVAAGPGAGPHVKVFDGVSGAEIRSFFAYDSGFTGGVFIGLGDLTGDGRADIVTGAGPGAGPHVKVFDGVGGAEIRSFFAFDETFQGGVSVRAGDIDGDGFADIIVGAGPGGGPHVKVFSGQNQNELDSVLVGDPAFTGGVLVGAGNFAFDFRSEVVVSTNGRLSVIGYEKAGAKLTRYVEQDNIVPFGEGIDAAPASIRLGNGNTAILVGAVGQSATRVMIIDRTSNSVRSFSAFEGLVFAGVNVG